MDGSVQLGIVGCVERVTLDRLRVRLPCRIDTGACTSALHVVSLEPEDDGKRVRFVVRGRRRGELVEVAAHVHVLRWARVRAANGGVETRAFVPLRVRLGGAVFPIEVGLTDREGMRYPMLLGRSALRGRYLVDVDRRFVLARRGAPP